MWNGNKRSETRKMQFEYYLKSKNFLPANRFFQNYDAFKFIKGNVINYFARNFRAQGNSYHHKKYDYVEFPIETRNTNVFRKVVLEEGNASDDTLYYSRKSSHTYSREKGREVSNDKRVWKGKSKIFPMEKKFPDESESITETKRKFNTKSLNIHGGHASCNDANRT